MRFIALILLIHLHGMSVCAAEIYLRAGDLAWASFTKMQGAFGSGTMWTINHGTGELLAGEQYRVGFYEDWTNNIPIYEFKVGTLAGLGSLRAGDADP